MGACGGVGVMVMVERKGPLIPSTLRKKIFGFGSTLQASPIPNRLKLRLDPVFRPESSSVIW